MNLKSNLIKLSKMILQLSSLHTDEGIELIYDGDLIIGTEIFIENEGEYVLAADGGYKVGDRTIVVKDGKVEDIIIAATVEEPTETVEGPEQIVEETIVEETIVEEPTVDPKDAIIDELNARLAEKEQLISELESKIKELEEKLATKEEELQMSADVSAKEKMKKLPINTSGLKFNSWK